MKKAKKKQKNRTPSLPDHHSTKLPFIEHLHELRKRLFWVALSIGVWGAAAYFVQQHVVTLLLRPARSQQFIYTSVGGGIDFLFRICVYAGIICSIPVIMFQTLKYLEPLIRREAMRFMLWGSAVSGLLAIAGMVFGYLFGLPAALHFLLHQFTSDQIHPLLTIQSYMSFVSLYMFGSALLFQGPLLLVLINRIKPLKPSGLLGMERWVILIAFILGGIMNPSPRWQDQLLLAGPIIGAYQVGILLVWFTNRHGSHPAHIRALIEQDDTARVERLARFEQARATFQTVQSQVAAADSASAATKATHSGIHTPPAQKHQPPRTYTRPHAYRPVQTATPAQTTRSIPITDLRTEA